MWHLLVAIWLHSYPAHISDVIKLYAFLAMSLSCPADNVYELEKDVFLRFKAVGSAVRLDRIEVYVQHFGLRKIPFTCMPDGLSGKILLRDGRNEAAINKDFFNPI